ncbi:hypothetical protein V6N13_146773 [Hibiscus sabdariffa]|uniref:Uncharacterized protein n=1 Tax=Hibiscus sabdariffa TaxID=183260 RepID=A0ABR2TUE4_9ROSI
MGRAPCCEKVGLKRGRWTAEEDEILTNYIQTHGEGSWRSLPKNAGLLRCGKSCRLRWINYLRADLKRGNFTVEEEETIIKMHELLGNRWSLIASQLKGRTDNEIKNYWNSRLSRKIYRFRKPSRESLPVIMNVRDGGSASNSYRPTDHNVSSIDEAVPFPSTPLLEKETFTAAAYGEMFEPCPNGCVEEETDVLGPFGSMESSEALCFDDGLVQTNVDEMSGSGDPRPITIAANKEEIERGDPYGDFEDGFIDGGELGSLDWDWERVVRWNELCDEGSTLAWHRRYKLVPLFFLLSLFPLFVCKTHVEKH